MGPLAKILQGQVAAGELSHDKVQAAVASKLDALTEALAAGRPAPVKKSFWDRFSAPQKPAPVRGLYVHGGVGRGKSMLMDLFFDHLPIERKQRAHFHEFMADVQKRLNELRKAGGDDDPVAKVGEQIAAKTDILCFDEFHVVNIADAMIIRRLFETLFEHGTVLVATSNWPPSRLYENGLNRDRFLPFIDLLETHAEVVPLDGDTDYRLRALIAADVYYQPLNAETDAAMQARFAAMSGGQKVSAKTVAVGSRQINIAAAVDGLAWFDFPELCAQPLGPQDYLALSENFHTVFLAHVPKLDAAMRNEARRLMTLIDVLYERRVILVMSAAAGPDALYVAGDGAFEFERTASRLIEMQSQDYLQSCRARELSSLPKEFAPFALTNDLI